MKKKWKGYLRYKYIIETPLLLSFLISSTGCTRITEVIKPFTHSSDQYAEKLATEILNTTDIKGGLVVHLGCKGGRLTSALHLNQRYLVHGLTRSKEDLKEARKYIHEQGIYGKVSVELLREELLPYTDNLVNLLVVEEISGIQMKEIMRVLTPRGVAYIKEDGEWKMKIKPWSDQIDEWTHYLHGPDNNAVAHDDLVGPPRHLQWISGPLFCRSHELNTSIIAIVSSNGRLFYILDEGPIGVKDPRLPSQWSLVARDGFSGVLLWKRSIPDWGWRQWSKKELAGRDWAEIRSQRAKSPIVLSRRLVTVEDVVYVTLGYDAPVTAIDARTGKKISEYRSTKGTDEILYNQGILILRRKNISGVKVNTESILALNASDGNVLWEVEEDRILPLSLASRNNRVFFHNYKSIISIDLKSGKEIWRLKVKGGSDKWWGVEESLIVTNEVVLFLGPKSIIALSVKNGKKLWEGKGARGPAVMNPPSIFFSNGLVWYGGNLSVLPGNDSRETLFSIYGYDPITGEVEKEINVKNLISPGHHFRCYRSKATNRYFLWAKRGVEFLDLKGNNHMRNNWLRAPCKTGFMPCNGLLYIPPHQCFCYPGAKINGFNALANQVQPERWNRKDIKENRLERGPAYNSNIEEIASTTVEWPTYRHDAKRSGSVPSSIPVELNNLWQTELGGKLTQPIVVAGKLFISRIDANRIYCLDAASGDIKWTYTAGGVVDSPPTYYRGLLLFGSADGWVYCLSASNGELVWRFRGSPVDRRVVAFNRLESAWPIHGSILIKDGIAYFAAGRSTYLDGGIYIYGLDPKSGNKLYDNHLEGPYPKIPEEPGRPFDVEGARSEVLVSDSEYIYLRQLKFNKKLQRQETPRITQLGDREVGLHLFSTSSLLDDSWWDRSYWMYSARWPGYYFGYQAPKSGQILVFDNSTTFGVKCYVERSHLSPMHTPGQGYLLFADKNDTEPILVGKDGKPKPVKWLPSISKVWIDNLKWIGDYKDPAINSGKGTGFTRPEAPIWSEWIPIRIRAMVLADSTLFIAGPPDIIFPDDPLATFEGRKGGYLWVISSSGKKLKEYKLSTLPIFDGIIAADNNLYLSSENGNIICWGNK